MTISITDRPEGQREDYLFFTFADRTFKALHEVRTNDAAQPVVVLSIAPTDDAGHALSLPNGEPDVTWHSHTFTEVELSEEGFDLGQKITGFISAMADRKNREIAARASLAGVGDLWRSGGLNPGGAGQ